MTDLFAACARFATGVIADVVPPSVRRDIEATALVRRDRDDVVIEAGPWRPRIPARHLLPSLAILTPRPYSVRFELAGRRHGAWSPWVGTVTLGDASFAALASVAGGLRVDIDECTAAPGVDAVRLRARVRGLSEDRLGELPWLLTLSAHASGAQVQDTDAPKVIRALGVPARSQMVEPEAVRSRICSPTSTAMVLEYFDRAVATSALAGEVFHAGTDRYGVWPAAIKAAASHGVPGYLLRFPDWPTAAWCLERRLPIVASLRYASGALAGAAMPETSGHLVVLTGIEDDEVLVNDPAAATTMEVPRRYRRDEVVAAWLAGSGVGYVFFRA